MVVELFENGSVLISDLKFGKQFKVNGHHLKPNLIAEPPTPADKVNLHLLEIHENVIMVHLISSIIVALLSFVWLKT